MSTYICESCNKNFLAYPSTKRGKHFFCSPGCYGKHLSKVKKGIQPKNVIGGWNKGKTMPQITEKKHPRWVGGRHRLNSGYIIVYVANHPYSFNKTGGGGYMLEHRRVMEEHLGRILCPNEMVHHINGVRDDNRIENLRVFDNNSSHTKHHNCAKNRDTLGRFIKQS